MGIQRSRTKKRTATQSNPHKTMVTSRMRTESKIFLPVTGSSASPKMYCPGFSNWM